MIRLTAIAAIVAALTACDQYSIRNAPEAAANIRARANVELCGLSKERRQAYFNQVHANGTGFTDSLICRS